MLFIISKRIYKILFVTTGNGNRSQKFGSVVFQGNTNSLLKKEIPLKIKTDSTMVIKEQ